MGIRPSVGRVVCSRRAPVPTLGPMSPTRHLPVPAVAIAALLAGCIGRATLPRDDSPTVLARQLIPGPSPAEPGSYAVRTLAYGSGTDRRRRVFRDSVAIRTTPVDASPFVSFEPDMAKERRKYWGFEPKKFPLNARVWYPEGDGPFPLVLVVHGNHDMKDFSDPGYAYLGEHLASRGFILASVDMNFLNGPTRNENDARGWMLLQHVRAWKAFNETAGGPFHGKVDMGNVALMGHSRGGEAVGHAAAFNRMPYYPDDAKVKLGFNFDIKALVAIAPVDGQYRPAGRLVPIENVSYLVFHGSHDADVSTFHGVRTYQRVRFTDGKPHFKAAVFMWRANHGQWNTVWGNKDSGPRSARYLNLKQLVDPAAQRQFAKVYVTAFLEATLRGDRRLLPLFRDHRAAGAWLPRTMYFTRFQESTFRPLADFEEDVDVATGTVPGVRLAGDSLGTWKENVLPFRWRNEMQNNSAVWLGWNNRVADGDSTRPGRPAAYAVTLPDTLARAWQLDGGSSLSLVLGAVDERPGPRTPAKDSTARDSTARDTARAAAGKARGRKRPSAKKEPADTLPLDLTVELADADGDRARLPLGRFGVIRKPLETYISRRPRREKERFASLRELVLQSYVMPLADFVTENPRLDPGRLSEVRLVFDRATAGTVVVDEVGFSKMDAAFLAAAPPRERSAR